jgi:hypothetical protein
MVNVMDDGVDENYASYLLNLNDGMNDYYTLNDQTSLANINPSESKQVPRSGENIVTV